MIYPSTYNEMRTWVSVRKFCTLFELTNEQVENLYELTRTKQIIQIKGIPDGTIVSYLQNGQEDKITVASKMDPNMYESASITPTGLVLTYTAAYLAAQAASRSSSGGSGSNNNNNNNNNN